MTLSVRVLMVAIIAALALCLPMVAAAQLDGSPLGRTAETLGGGSDETLSTETRDMGAPGEKPDLGNIESAIQQLGITPSEALRLKAEVGKGGGPTSDEVEELCARLAAKHFSGAEAESIAKTLGLTPGMVTQLKACSGTTTGNNEEARTGFRESSRGVERPGEASTERSSIERNFGQLDSPLAQAEAPTTQNLTQFGYALFSKPVSTFAPVTNVPVGSDYVIGPGDELNILLWGRMNRTLRLKVERDGTILIPEIGPLQIAGLTFAQAKQLIESREGQITGVQVDVTMGQLKTIQVFVIGEVKQPGAYTVSALSRISNALVAAGGINKVGSLRSVQLRRGNQLVKVIDLYDMLLHGDTASDERLEAQDVVFVPVIGAVAGVVGDVKRPAIYELSSHETSVKSVLDLAGGIGAFGYSQRIQVERVENHERRIALDVNSAALRSQKFQVRDGDLIKIYGVLPQQQNVVTLKGNVNRPGKYQWSNGMKVADLIRQGEGVAPHTFFKYALIRRLEGQDRKVRLVPVDLESALSDHQSTPANVALLPRDEVTIFSEDQLQDYATVTVVGEVRKPGVYPLNPGMKVSDLVYLAGGLKDEAYLQEAELARTEVVEGAKTRHSYTTVDLRSALNGGDADDRALARNDELFVRRVPLWHLPAVVEVKGQVLRPGPYTVRQGERLSSLLERAGGLLPDAYLPGFVFLRQSVKELQEQRTKEIQQRVQQDIARVALQPHQSSENVAVKSENLQMLNRILSQSQDQKVQGRVVVHIRSLDSLGGSVDDLVLEDHDQIFVPRRPSSVNVMGQVYNPTAILFEPSLTVRDYLERAGGPSETADQDHIFVIKVDGSVLTDDEIRNGGRAHHFPLLAVVGSSGLMGTRLEPGDTVFVPEKLYYRDTWQLSKDLIQVIYQGAISIATVGLLVAR